MRIKANYTIDEKVKADFDKFCKEKAINKSLWVEQRMKELLSENGYIFVDAYSIKEAKK